MSGARVLPSFSLRAGALGSVLTLLAVTALEVRSLASRLVKMWGVGGNFAGVATGLFAEGAGQDVSEPIVCNGIDHGRG